MAMKRGITVLLAMILLACTCGAAAEEKTIQVRTLTGTYFQEAENHPAIEGESPLTGLPCGEAYTPIMVPLDNSPEAHPLWGIGDASILFQVPLKENGATRLLALFGDRYPEQAGGVRAQLKRGDRERDRDEHGHKRLDLAVSVWMVLVGRRHPVPHAEDDGQVGNEVGRGMHRVRHKRARREHHATDGLRHGNGDVHRHSRVRHPPRPPHFLCLCHHTFHHLRIRLIIPNRPVQRPA